MIEPPDCRNKDIYNQTVHSLETFFLRSDLPLQQIKYLAGEIKEGIQRISPFIQQITQFVCPDCSDRCCISKHGYYSFEDLVYLHALGVKPPSCEFGRNDSDPCQFLTEHGCSMERSIRPSGCNWYFCDSLYDHLERNTGYRAFDHSLHDVATLWMEMTEEFSRISSRK